MTTAPAAWYPDPSGRYEYRYWDGVQWTAYVASLGQQSIDPLSGSSLAPQSDRRVARQAAKVVAGGPNSGGGTLFTEPVLVVNQTPKVHGSALGYVIYDQHGQRLGRIEELRGIRARAHEAYRGRTDDTRAYTFRILDSAEQILLTLSRPEKWFSGKSKMVVADPAGSVIGHITQETYGFAGSVATLAHAALSNVAAIASIGAGVAVRGAAGKVPGSAVSWVAGTAAGSVLEGSGIASRMSAAVEGLDKVGHVRFGLEAGGARLGAIVAESIDEWDFRVQDPSGAEFARITKTWAGWAKERFTRADNYVVQIPVPVSDPLRSLVVAAALTVDVALKQGAPVTGTRSRRRYR